MADIAYREVTVVLLREVSEILNDHKLEQKHGVLREVHEHVLYGAVIAMFMERIESSWRETGQEVQRKYWSDVSPSSNHWPQVQISGLVALLKQVSWIGLSERSAVGIVGNVGGAHARCDWRSA